MKKQVIHYLALDVHQPTSVGSVRDASGAVAMRPTVPTEATAVVRLVKSVGPRVHVAFEEGTQAQWLHDVLVPYAEKVIVWNIRGDRESGKKSDRLDADGLSDCLRAGTLRRWLSMADGGARTRAASPLRQLDVLLELRLSAKTAMAVEARRQQGWRILRSIPYFGNACPGQVHRLVLRV